MLEQTFQLEVTVGTQKLHLCRTLLNLRIVLVGIHQHIHRERDTRQILIHSVPDIVIRPILGCDTYAHFHNMELTTVRLVRATNVCIVGAGVIIPQREGRIHVFNAQQTSIGRDKDIVNILGIFYLVLNQCCLRHLLFQKVGTCCEHHATDEDAYCFIYLGNHNFQFSILNFQLETHVQSECHVKRYRIVESRILRVSSRELAALDGQQILG